MIKKNIVYVSSVSSNRNDINVCISAVCCNRTQTVYFFSFFLHCVLVYFFTFYCLMFATFLCVLRVRFYINNNCSAPSWFRWSSDK